MEEKLSRKGAEFAKKKNLAVFASLRETKKAVFRCPLKDFIGFLPKEFLLLRCFYKILAKIKKGAAHANFETVQNHT